MHSMRTLGMLVFIGVAACRTVEAPPPVVVNDEPVAAPIAVRPSVAPDRRGDEIVVCGRRVSIGAPVVLWTDVGGYDAYSTELHFPDEAPKDKPVGLRYQPGRKLAKAVDSKETRLGSLSGTSSCFDDARRAIDMFVLHYDVCGTSRQCFKILQDRRQLSVHFMLDVDGTLYQTLDLSDTAWHARQANPRSVGVEIANIGAYKPGDATLDAWYSTDEHGPRLKLPEWMKTSGIRTPGFIARPARAERVHGAIHGVEYEMHDLTPQQYDTLVKLAAALCTVFPRLEPDAPRDAAGKVRWDALSDEEFKAFHGILGHYHVTKDKQDPGPAFDWEPFLERVRARIAELGVKP